MIGLVLLLASCSCHLCAEGIALTTNADLSKTQSHALLVEAIQYLPRSGNLGFGTALMTPDERLSACRPLGSHC